MVDPADPVESIPEPKELRLLTDDQFLERGWPGELLPGKGRDMWVRRAESYVADQSKPPDGRERVRAVWLQNRVAPAYHTFTPRPDKDPVDDADAFG